jgi:hypothetical protein
VIILRKIDTTADLTNKEEAADLLKTLSLQFDDIAKLLNLRGPTTSRPALSSSYAGTQYFDTTLGLPIWWAGTAWVNAAGVGV